MKKIFTAFLLLVGLWLPADAARAADLFDRENPVEGGLNVYDVSDVFSDIYEKLDGVKWAGRDIGVAIEGLEKIHPDAHIALTDDRAVLVWKDTIIGNWPRPSAGDWNGFGQITTAILLKLRALVPGMAQMSDSELYSATVSALLRGIDENGRYIYSRRAEIAEDGRLLTSAGFEGLRDERGNFRVTGVYKGSAADNAGVREGDLVFEINGKSVAGMSDGDIAGELAGFNSGTLKMNIGDESGNRAIILRRASIMMADADVVWRTEKITNGDNAGQNAGILEIIVHAVSNNAVAIVNEALAKYQPIGIILDLRAASGDDERAAAKLAGLFLGKVPILRIVENEKEETEVIPGGNATIDGNIPVVVLASGGTRGTAEALAAAFYENGRGIVIGTPTAGHARLATNLDLKNGGGLELFNREVKTGLGRVLSGRGVFPIVCLSNIRNGQQQNAFFVNVINGDFNARDLNKDEKLDPAAVRRGCPQITSGADEDMVSSAVAIKILTDKRLFNALGAAQ
ncbi:MAG: S41 family peptidase [Proteobacteria bacterium]|nr:S41 family peptidase [Pseudomonadota bacterium]